MRLLFSIYAQKTNGDIEASIDGDFSINLMTFALKDICLMLIRNQEKLNKEYNDDGFLKISSFLDETKMGGMRKCEDEIQSHLKNVAYEEFKNDFVTLKQHYPTSQIF